MVKFRIRTKIMAVVTFLVVSVAVIFSGFSMQTAKASGNYAYPSTQYVKHDFTTAQNTTYTLPAIASINYGNALAMQAMADANEDPRPNADYDSATVKVTGNYGSYYTLGTGFIIGEHEIMTAAHVAHQFTGCTLTVTVPDANPYSDNSQTFNVVSSHVPKAYIDLVNHPTEQGTQDYDYAILTVNEDLSQYGSFLLGMGTNAAQANNITFYCHGFNENELKMSSGVISKAGELSYDFNIDTLGGSSGGPVFAKSSFGVKNVTNGDYKIQTYRTVVAITSKGQIGTTCTARIRPIIMQFAYDNDNL